jgi:hypothetical protein
MNAHDAMPDGTTAFRALRRHQKESPTPRKPVKTAVFIDDPGKELPPLPQYGLKNRLRMPNKTVP